MAPLLDKSSSVKKCHNETVDAKQNRLPFRWLLKKSKSSKSAKEMAQAENPQLTTVPTSKSCDSGITGLNAIDKCSSLLLWRLLPPRGNSAHCDKLDKKGTKSPSKSVKTSFSCGDVYGMLSAGKSPHTVATRSSQDISMTGEPEESHPLQSSQSSNRLTHSQSTHQLNGTVSSHEDLNRRSFLPEICHMVFCKLCLTLVPADKMYSLEDCGCVFCFPCMQQYLLVNIKEGNVVITCPDADCGFQGKVLISEVRDLVGDEAFYKFQRFKLNRDVELDPERTWCPTAGCETICNIRPPPPVPGKGVPVTCRNCDLTFCSVCKIRWHSGKTCAELRNEEEELPISDDEGSLIKRCPNCHVLIERDEGCAQMMCKRCKHVFCWHCLASLDDDFLLRHYDKGPCRNKLGHSRASMIWHRTQVVGIFAGFSFLLLVASPILLLAAPCLLCCRCRNCKFFYEEPTPL